MNCLIQFVSQQANPVAHSLTKISRLHASPHYFDFIPSSIHSFIMNEMRWACFLSKKKKRQPKPYSYRIQSKIIYLKKLKMGWNIDKW